MDTDEDATSAAAYDMFDAWLAAQSDEVQELDLLEQIDLYAAEAR